MKNLKITSKVLMVNVEFPLEVGPLKTTAIAGLHIYENEDGTKGADVDFMGQDNTTYMGVAIEGYTNWEKFLEFHREVGIDFGTILNDKFDEIWTKEFTTEFVKDIVF